MLAVVIVGGCFGGIVCGLEADLVGGIGVGVGGGGRVGR